MGGFNFDEESCRRIANAVRKIERMPVRLGQANGRQFRTNDGWHAVHNTSNEAIPSFGCARVLGMEELDSGNHSDIIKVAKADSTFARDYVFNGGREIPADGYGNMTYATDDLDVDVLLGSGETFTAGKGYGPKPGSWAVWAGYPEIIVARGSKPWGSETLLVGRTKLIDRALGKPAATILKGNSGTVNVWAGTAGSESLLGSMQISGVHNRYADATTGDFVETYWLDGQPFLSLAAGCATSPSTVTTIGASTEGSESASSDTWTACGATGLDLWDVSRLVYNENGDEKLYAMMRKLTFDKTGKLYSVSGETRMEVDAPEACTT